MLTATHITTKPIVTYNLKIAQMLKEDLDEMMDYYRQDFKRMYYRLQMYICKDLGDTRGTLLYRHLAHICDHPFTMIQFANENHHLLHLYHEFPLISDATAFRLITTTYLSDFYRLRAKVDASRCSDYEQFLIDHFYAILLSPTRDPKMICLADQDESYYEMKAHREEFVPDFLELQKDIYRRCMNILDYFCKV